jgi:hypothetical protein
MSPPTLMVMDDAPGSPAEMGSLQVILPVPVISRSPGTSRSIGQNAVIGVLIVQSPPTSVPPMPAQVCAADAWPGIPIARTRAASTTTASESFRAVFPMPLSMSFLLRWVKDRWQSPNVELPSGMRRLDPCLVSLLLILIRSERCTGQHVVAVRS